MARAGLEVWHAGCAGIGGESLERLLKENQVHTEYLKMTDLPCPSPGEQRQGIKDLTLLWEP